MTRRSRSREALDQALSPPPKTWPPPPAPPPVVAADLAADVALRLVCLEEAVKLGEVGETEAKTLTRAARFERYARRGLD